MGTFHDPAAFAATLSGRLDWTPDDLYRWSLTMAERCIEAREVVCDKVFSEIKPAGEKPEAVLARAYDPKFWRRQGGLALKRAKSTYAQHCKAVGGANDAKYVGEANQTWFKEGQKRQAEWAKSCVLLEKSQRTDVVTLADVMNNPAKRWAKTYTFIKGLQEVATNDNGLRWFMATITLPGEYHANPAMGLNTWAGSTVKEGFDEMMKGVNRMGAGLARSGIRKIGLGSEEPQQDETPHLHEGIFYKGARQYWAYLEGYARQFPGPLKVVLGAKVKRVIVYPTLAAVLARKGVPASEKAPGRVTITVGKAGVGAFASYMAKYISKGIGKTLEADDADHASVAAVLAHRNAQGIRGWRFYGLPEGCLSGWDELRRVDEKKDKPTDERLRELVDLAKAGKAGDFIRRLGGIDVSAKPSRFLGLRLQTQSRVTQYGESSKRTIGVHLLDFTREERLVATGRTTKHGRPQLRKRVFVEFTVLDTVRTRFTEWEIMTKTEVAGLLGFTEGQNRSVGVTHNCPRGAVSGEDAQERAIRAPLDESTVVVSSAGSGKTHVLTERAKFLVQNGVREQDVLITTYTRKAAQELAERLRKKGVGGVRVGTMHSLGLEMLGGGTLGFDEMITKSTALGEERFHLLVDEAQDLNPEQIAWAKAHAKTLFVVGDPNQAIYGFRGSAPEGIGELLRHVQGLKGVTPDMFDSTPEVVMLENRRSTSTIVSLGNAVVDGEAWSGREGVPVEVHSATSRVDELAAIVERAQGALVLVRTNRERIEVKAALAMAGQEPLDVMTVHASKGKEADRVVLACGLLKSKTASEAEERRLLYVAVTRARNELVITSTGMLPAALDTALKTFGSGSA